MELLIKTLDTILTVNDGLQWLLKITNGVQRRGVLLTWLLRCDTTCMAKVNEVARARRRSRVILLELLGLVGGLRLLNLRLLSLLELLWLRCSGGYRSGRSNLLSGLFLSLRLWLSFRLCRCLSLLAWQDGCDGENLLDNLIRCLAVAGRM